MMKIDRTQQAYIPKYRLLQNAMFSASDCDLMINAPGTSCAWRILLIIPSAKLFSYWLTI